jgi:S-adenosylmethionine-diacylgycerolhomoserine-N-methlytransferase
MHAVPSPKEENHFGLMDQVYRRQRHIYDFTRKYYLFGRDSLIRDLRLKPGDRLVEIGCGTARNLIAIARRYPRAKLFGLDASAEMLETALGQIKRAGLESHITLRHGLAENLTPGMFGEASFEHAVFSYSLSMIPDWRSALAAGEAVLSEQGLVHIVDFADLRDLPGRAVLRSWLKMFHVSPRAELVRALETKAEKDALTFLPGRYAFLARLSKGKAGTEACGTTVTARD